MRRLKYSRRIGELTFRTYHCLSVTFLTNVIYLFGLELISKLLNWASNVVVAMTMESKVTRTSGLSSSPLSVVKQHFQQSPRRAKTGEGEAAGDH